MPVSDDEMLDAIEAIAEAMFVDTFLAREPARAARFKVQNMSVRARYYAMARVAWLEMSKRYTLVVRQESTDGG